MKTVKKFRLKNKKVIIRCDLNVPMKEGKIEDDTRIKESIKTISYLLKKKAKIIILSHLGRVKEEKDKETNSLSEVARRMSELVDVPITFVPHTRGKEVERVINDMAMGEVVMLENTRFEDLNGKLESGNDPELAKYWASLGDIFINDAFGTLHRAHASNVGIASLLPSGIGFLEEKEINEITSAIKKPKRPLVVVLGGAKVSDKIGVIENAVKIADYVLIGGGMPFTFYKALGYNIGLSIVDEDSIDFCKRIYEENKDKIKLPEDIIVGTSISNETNTRFTDKDKIGNNEIGLDIGPSTINEFKKILLNAKTIVWNGPMGMFEIPKFSNGTRKICEAISNSKAKIVAGGGDTINAINKFEFNNHNAHISTGGGASLEMLEGKDLPGIVAINKK